MLHTKSQGHLEKKPFKGVLPWWPCWSCNQDHLSKLFTRILIHMRLSLIGRVVSEENMFENVDGRTTEGRRSHWYTISSPMRLRLM